MEYGVSEQRKGKKQKWKKRNVYKKGGKYRTIKGIDGK
jgi:hypothetical protein